MHFSYRHAILQNMSSENWYKLDNAAKIMPGTVRGADTRVFRIVCELTEEIDPEVLQIALEEAVREFPYFNCVLRKGLFWYYLDVSRLCPVVEEDHLPACSAIYRSGRRNLLYRVSYYGCRINLEMFHALADGTGGFRFLRRIVINYLRQKYDIAAGNREDRSSVSERAADDFNKYYSTAKGTESMLSKMRKRSFQLKGLRDPLRRSHLIEGRVSAAKFMAAAHSYNTTAGVLMAAIYIKAVLDSMSLRDIKRPIVITVPVDLRRYFPSVTARNFFGVVNVEYMPKRLDDSLDDIIAFTEKAFKELLTKENILATMNSGTNYEHNIGIKIVPLVIKELGVSSIGFLAKKGVTATVSNLGIIKLPESFEGYVKQFSAFMSSAKMQVTIATYKDNMVFGFCSSFEESPVILNFFRILSDFGLSAVIASNDSDILPEKPVKQKKQKQEKKEKLQKAKRPKA